MDAKYLGWFGVRGFRYMRASLSKLRSFVPSRTLLAAGSAIVAAVAVAGLSSAGAETLEAVTLRAMIDSPKLKADEARQDGTRQELTAARMAVLPSVSVNFDSTFNGG